MNVIRSLFFCLQRIYGFHIFATVFCSPFVCTLILTLRVVWTKMLKSASIQEYCF
uniref:Uncharacterized protein n=1 Tax=Arundo donax TaxID=35708 RepID=A0A0A9BWD8_ARUDO